jgi:hypothetical protein
MHRDEVDKIFDKVAPKLLSGCFSSHKPIAVILGGQPASGKSNLFDIIEREHHVTFLKVNGDMYRNNHPDHKTLIKNYISYSSETQIFSNIFTERLIDEACKHKFNIIVEGTMRNSDVPITTAQKFRQAGFKVEAYIIAAPSIVSELGIYDRYYREIQINGYGRLSDINSHNEAVEGLRISVDKLYLTKAVDKISIFNYCAKEKIQQNDYDGTKWSYPSIPSEIIDKTRNTQIVNIEFVNSCIERAEKLQENIFTNLKPFISVILEKLRNIEKIL